MKAFDDSSCSGNSYGGQYKVAVTAQSMAMTSGREDRVSGFCTHTFP